MAAEETRNRADLQPLIDVRLNNPADRPHWRRIIWGVISVSAVSPLPELLGKASGEWWAEFVRDLIQTAEPSLRECGLLILQNISGQISFLSPECKTLFNQAATAALSYQIDQKTDPSPRDRVVIERVCQTMEANRQEAAALIRRCLSQEELRRSGYVLAYGLANQIECIGRADRRLLIEVYEQVFGYFEGDETVVPTNDTQIMPMGARKDQEYEMALFVLVRAFPKILAAYPEEATHIVIRTIWSYAVSETEGFFRDDGEKNRIAANPEVEIIWDGSPCAFLEDGSNPSLGDEENRHIEDAIFALRPEQFTDLSEERRRDHVPIIKARLLHRMQEKCRSEKAQEYIAGFDSDLLTLRENSWGGLQEALTYLQTPSCCDLKASHFS